VVVISIERLTGGLTPADPANPRTFPAVWNQTATDIELLDGSIEGRADAQIAAAVISDLANVDAPAPDDGDVLVFDDVLGEWVSGKAAAGAVGGGTDEIFWENDQTVTTSYSISSGKNAMTAGPVAIGSAVTVTVPAGSVWTVV
jgi:hypothetical protein